MDCRPAGGYQSRLDQEEQKPGACERAMGCHEPRRRRDPPRLVDQPNGRTAKKAFSWQ
jgi:hypothetical protein